MNQTFVISLFLSFMFFCQDSLYGQSANEKIVNVSNTVNLANNTLSNANAATQNVKETTKNIKNTFGGLFKGKKKDTLSAPKADTLYTSKNGPATTITILITAIDYVKLKAIEDSVKMIKGVTSTAKKFSSVSSTLEIGFWGQADELWDMFPAALKDSLDLLDLTEAKISLNNKK